MMPLLAALAFLKKLLIQRNIFIFRHLTHSSELAAHALNLPELLLSVPIRCLRLHRIDSHGLLDPLSTFYKSGRCRFGLQ